MPDYTAAKIYRLVNSADDQVYVGSTCGTLNRRFAKHKKDSRRYPTQRVYAHVANGGGWDSWSIELVEAVPCKSLTELRAHERRYVETIGTLNTQLPGNFAMYATALDYCRAYYAQNKAKVNERRQLYRAENSEAINKRKAEYRAANRDAINEKRRIRRAAAVSKK